MINWQSLFFNSLWILGLSLLLAAFSYNAWLAAENDRKLRMQLSRPGFIRWVWTAVLLISIGLLGVSQQLWEIILWAVMALISVVNIGLLSRKTTFQERT
jgi:hypothetical protein